MKMVRLGMLAVLVGWVSVVGLSLRAQDPEVKAPAVKQAELRAGYLEDLAAAHLLAQFGKEHKAPEALIAAGSLLLKVDGLMMKNKFEELKEKPTDEKGGEIKDEVVASLALRAQAIAWFDDAAFKAKGTKLADSVDALIKEAVARKYADEEIKERGAAGGPKRVTRNIGPNQTHVYRYNFIGGLPAAIALTSSGQSRLRFTIEGPQGGNLFNLLCTVANYYWTPRMTGQFTIRVHNSGNNSTTYTLLTN